MNGSALMQRTNGASFVRRCRRGLTMLVAIALVLMSSACGRRVELTPRNQLPAEPQRVIAGNTIILDALLALDVPVVGAPIYADRDPLPPYLADQAQDVQPVGTTSSPSIEAITALQPDLIIIPDAAPFVDAAGQLLPIAPTVAVPALTRSDWKTTLRSVAEVTGRSARAAELLSDWELRVASVRDLLSRNPPGEVSVVRYFNDSARYLPAGSSFAGQILDEAGVPGPAQQADGAGRPFVEVSLEQIDALDGDVIFVIAVDTDTQRRFERQPLWQQLRAVQAGRVHYVDQHWFSGNLLAAHAILDDLEHYVLEGVPR